MDQDQPPTLDQAARSAASQPPAEVFTPDAQPECSRSNLLDSADMRKARMMQLLKGKEKDWTPVAQRARPLQLLDLPMDILKDIMKEVLNAEAFDLAFLTNARHRSHIQTISHL